MSALTVAEIELTDGKKYEMNFTGGAIVNIEKTLDRPISKVFQDMEQGAKFTDLLVIIYEGLRASGFRMKFNEFTSLTHFSHIQKYLAAIVKGFEAAEVVPSKDPLEDGPIDLESIGTNS